MTISESRKIIKDTAHKFTGYLEANSDVMQYLVERGIKPELIEQERIGYCPPFYNHWWPLLRGRITTPIHDINGDIVVFAGRQYDPDAKKATEYVRNCYYSKTGTFDTEKMVNVWNNAKWINEPYDKSRYLFNLSFAKESIRQKKYAVVVEGYFDALILASNNLPNTVAVCGAFISQRQAILLSRYCDDVVLLLDGDTAGIEASKTISAILQDIDINPHIIYLPEKYDPDEFILKVGGKKMESILDTVVNENKKELKLKLRS